MNITIDDISPLLQFVSVSSGWTTNNTGDGATPLYYDGTFHSTYGNGDYMSFTFNASAIYVFGAFRANHGLYSTQLDGGNLGYSFGYSATDKIQNPLFVSKGLDVTREHNLVITNLPTQSDPPATAANPLYLDIDYIILTTADTDKVYTTTYDDFSPAFSYSGYQGQTTYPKEWYNGTAHTTQNITDTAEFNFNGSSVQIFGGINYNHGNYSVALDGGLTQLYNGTYFNLTQNATIFLATNLTDGPHTVTLKNAAQGKIFSIDWAVTNSSISPDLGSNSTNTTTGSSDTDGGGSSHTGAIAGGVVGGVAALGLIAFCVWFFVIRKKRRHGGGKSYDPVDLNGGPNAGHNGFDGAEVAPFPASTAAVYGSSNAGTAPTQMSQNTGPFLTTIPPPPPSNATSYPRSAAPTSPSHGSSNAYDSLAAYTTTSGHTESGRTESSSAAPVPAPATQPTAVGLGAGAGAPKTRGVPLPFTSSPAPRPAVPENRMSVHGREVDYGPIPLSPGEEHGDELLPPDYQQATEPLPGQRRAD